MLWLFGGGGIYIALNRMNYAITVHQVGDSIHIYDFCNN